MISKVSVVLILLLCVRVFSSLVFVFFSAFCPVDLIFVLFGLYDVRTYWIHRRAAADGQSSNIQT